MTKTKEKSTPKPLVEKLIEEFQDDYNSLSSIRAEFEEKEKMFLGKVDDDGTTKSRVFDPRVSTYILERASRVMAQNPTGVVRGAGKKDEQAAKLFNLILKNYVIPNANSQFDFLTKARLLDIYSNVYGSYGVLVDWVVKDDYVGPDFYLIPIRNLIFQSSAQSFNDSDYVYVISYVTEEWLKSRDKSVWKNIDKVLEKKESEKEEKSYTENHYGGGQKSYQLITKFEKNRWITFSKEAKTILRDIPNPQKNHRLPVVLKHCFPLIDRIIGLGEIERTYTLQKALNSLLNMYLDGVKMSIFPPLMIDAKNVYLRSLTYQPAAKWLVKQQGAVQQLPLSPAGTNVFQNTFGFLNAAILNAFGTTDVATAPNTEVQIGKTPRALAMLQYRESSRDNWDRFMLERALEEILDRFVDLISKRQKKPMKFTISKEEYETIKDINPDLASVFETSKYGEIIIKENGIKNNTCRFFIEAGSTLRKDELLENENLTAILSLILKLPGAVEQIAKDGKVRFGETVINFGELLKQWIITSGVKNYDKILSTEPGTSEPSQVNFEDLKDVISGFTPDLQELAQKIYGQQGGQSNPAVASSPFEGAGVEETQNGV